MALTYEKVLKVISKPTDMRKDFEVNNLMPWFKKKSNIFKQLKSELLLDIIKNLQFLSTKRDDIIIKQGETGDCMYILLRGKVTIYILYAPKQEGEGGDKPAQPLIGEPKPGESVRSTLGTFVTSLGPGASFGEVALISEDAIRTASIIVDEPSDFIVVDRALYNRSVQSVLKKEFEDKSNFIATSPFFRSWAPKYKKQLAMAMEKETFPYDCVLTKQGNPLRGIYFILSGEVKLMMDSQQHLTQYRFSTPHTSSHGRQEDTEVSDSEPADSDDSTNSESSDQLLERFMKGSMKRSAHEVCLLGFNESIGDIEVLLDLDTYAHTAICTQRTEVLVLEMKHYERLLVKRNPKTIEKLKGSLELKLKARTSKHIEKVLPFMKHLCDKAEDFNEKKKQHGVKMSDRSQRSSGRTLSSSFDSFVPPRGPLIDLYGPGTVFHRIRKREQARQKREKKKQQFVNGSGNGKAKLSATLISLHSSAPVSVSDSPGSKGEEEAEATPTMRFISHNPVPAQLQAAAPPRREDPNLRSLEERMREWLAYDMNNPTIRPTLRKSQSQTQIMIHSMNDIKGRKRGQSVDKGQGLPLIDTGPAEDDELHVGPSFMHYIARQYTFHCTDGEFHGGKCWGSPIMTSPACSE